MAKKLSAGILLYRTTDEGLRVLLVHPGGPFWARKDAGAWSIPKGEYEEGDDPRAAAVRELEEETGLKVDEADLAELGSIKQKSGKIVIAWACPGDFDPSKLQSNTFELEWPPRSGVMKEFPEVDRAEWFTLAQAAEKITTGQDQLLKRLAEMI